MSSASVNLEAKAAACLEGAARWFLRSGIQRPGGGVARFYRTEPGQYAPVSTEITGYAVSTLLFLYRMTRQQELFEAARQAAGFLMERAWDGQLHVLPFELAEFGGDGSLAYFFDSGIVCRGLLAWYRATGDRQALEIAIQCGESMARDFHLPGAAPGVFAPVIALPSKEPLEQDSCWSRRPGCYQLKAARAWLELAEATSDLKYLDYYEQVLRAALDTHEEFLPDPEGPRRTMDRLHAYCYFLEGLLPYLHKRKVETALRKGMARVRSELRRLAGGFVRCDVYAQLLRVAVLAEAAGVEPLDAAEAVDDALGVISFQMHHSDAALEGGFWFGREAGRMLSFINPVSTAFAAQAIEYWRCWLEGDPPAALEDLI